jgi:hypothetical protein
MLDSLNSPTGQWAWSLSDRLEDAAGNMIVYLLFIGMAQGVLTLGAVGLSVPLGFWRGWADYWRLTARVIIFSICLYLCGCLGDGIFVAMFHHVLYSNHDSIGDFVPWLPSVRWIVKPGLGGTLLDGVSPITLRAAWAAVALPVWLVTMWCFSKARLRFDAHFGSGAGWHSKAASRPHGTTSAPPTL